MRKKTFVRFLNLRKQENKSCFFPVLLFLKQRQCKPRAEAKLAWIMPRCSLSSVRFLRNKDSANRGQKQSLLRLCARCNLSSVRFLRNKDSANREQKQSLLGLCARCSLSSVRFLRNKDSANREQKQSLLGLCARCSLSSVRFLRNKDSANREQKQSLLGLCARCSLSSVRFFEAKINKICHFYRPAFFYFPEKISPSGFFDRAFSEKRTKQLPPIHIRIKKHIFLKEKLSELKFSVETHPFGSEAEEIAFFKYRKPALPGWLISFYEILRIETRRLLDVEMPDEWNRA